MKVTDSLFDYNFFENNNNLLRLLNYFNNPHKSLRVINVVGTNGKGSVSTALIEQLVFNKKKVGLFISPAFFEHNERIQINNQNISDQKLNEYIMKYEKHWKAFQLKFFEIFLFIAILYFIENKVDIAVIEAGIGGSRDCTSILNNQDAVLLTSVSYDHVEILGNSIESIIKNKVGILKNSNLIYIAKSNEKYLNIIKQYVRPEQINSCGYFSDVQNLNQKDNLGIVVNYCLKNNYQINKSLLVNKRLLGRFTILRKEPLFLIDGAHNLDAVKKLFDNLKTINKKDIIFLFASSSKKDFNSILKYFKENKLKVYITEFEHDKSWQINQIDYQNKIINWQKFIKNNYNKNIVVFGSLYFIPLVKIFFDSYNN